MKLSVEALQKAGRPVEDQDLYQTLGCDDPEGFEEALGQLCEERKVAVSHEKLFKDKALDAVREFMTPPYCKKENQMQPLRMSEDERRQRAFQASVEKGHVKTRRMIAVVGQA